jgi:hypothetical protein
MLDAHPDLAIPPETGFLTLAPRLRGHGDRLRKRFYRSVTSYPKTGPAWPDFGITEGAFLSALCDISSFTPAEGFRAFYRLYASRFGKTRWGDKTPLYCKEIDLIRKVLPETRFIHIIRDGRDVALSLRQQWFSPGWDIRTQAAFWQEAVIAGRRAGVGRPDYLEVRYEDLVLSTRPSLERICEFIELDYDESMHDYYKGAPERLREHEGRVLPDGSTLTEQQRHRQQQKAQEPPDPSYVFGWRKAMSGGERVGFRDVAGALLEELGYDV